jgi:pimeloyl-ACP methyl ester carboxylesterase
MKLAATVFAAASGALALASSALAASQFVRLPDDRRIWVEHDPAPAGKPTLVLLNGLTYATKDWRPLTRELKARGLGVLRLDFEGQGKTLAEHGPATAAYPYADQAKDVVLVLEALAVDAPVDVVGLSYGGGIAVALGGLHPDKVRSLVLLAPYTQPVQAQDDWVRTQVAYARALNPLNPATDDELYDHYMRLLIYGTYPMVEPSLLDHPYRLEAAYRLVQGIRKLPVEELSSQFADQALHLVVAGEDQYLTSGELDRFWRETPARARGSRIVLQGVQHKIPEIVPKYLAAWLALVAAGDARLTGGASFRGLPAAGEARSGSVVIPMPVE